ncbi:MAG: MIP/aquaporin family protein [Spirochaetia bacterium]
MNEKSLGREVIGEIFGTFILIVLGDGVVANVGLAPRALFSGWYWVTVGWAMAVIIAVYISGGVSGAHLNPAVTIGLAVKRGFPAKKILPFILAQLVGAFLGALVVYLCYRDGLQAAGMPNVWTSGPGSVFGQTYWNGGVHEALGDYSLITACITEVVGTMMLLLAVLASGDSKNMGLMHNLAPMLVGGVVLAVGLSLGGPSGYAINPARDFGPRLFGLIAGTKGLFDGIYWLVAPIISPIIGGVLGVLFYDWFITPAFKNKAA